MEIRALELSQGIYSLLDDDTYDWLHHWKWSVAITKIKKKYARRMMLHPTTDKPTFIYLHKIVSGISKDYKLHFRDRNSLNMQRANLKIVNLRDKEVKWFGSSSKSKFKGVFWDKYYGLWRAQIKDLPISYHYAEMDAAKAFNKVSVDFYGENAEYNNMEIEEL